MLTLPAIDFETIGLGNTQRFLGDFPSYCSPAARTEHVSIRPSGNGLSTSHSTPYLAKEIAVGSQYSDESDSASESDQEEAAIKVNFYVKDSCFHFMDPSSLKANYDVTAETVFFQVVMRLDECCESSTVRNLKSIPAELIKQILRTPEKTIQINWKEHNFQLHFIANGAMDEKTVSARINDLNKGLCREIAGSDDVHFYEKTTYFPPIKRV